MNELVLEIIMRLFAAVAKLKMAGMDVSTRHFVKVYLENMYSSAIASKYLKIYDDELSSFTKKRGFKSRKQDSKVSVKILMICERLNKELNQKQKLQIVIKFLELLKHNHKEGAKASFIQSISDVISSIASFLNIPNDEFDICRAFIMDSFDEFPMQSKLLIIDNNEEVSHLKKIIKRSFEGKVYLLWIDSISGFLLKSATNSEIFISGQYISIDQVYFFSPGDTIKSSFLEPIYFNELSKPFIISSSDESFFYQVRDLEFRYKKSKNGLRKISFDVHSGQLVGIMGASGAGKSTFLNLLAVKTKPKTGKIYLNGTDIVQNDEAVKGLIGFVPQDDVLFEELTVHENLFYNAKLNFKGLDNDKINELVEDVLRDLDLYKVKDLKVGSPVHKYISGGERKRLNIALELIREPAVLMIDEPTSGLSSKDSENVIDLLKEQTLRGKLVFINIHQPSSDIFKLLDYLILIDKGGFPVYIGEPLNAIEYLKKALSQVGAEDNECPSCGNVNPEEIFRLIDTKAVDTYGEFTSERRMHPEHWFYLFRKKLKKHTDVFQGDIPKIKYELPGKLKQFLTFTKRNYQTKIANRQFMLLALTISPILAILLNGIAKYIPVSGSDAFVYSFAKNINVPALLFMYIIVSLFVGLIVSAEELYKDTRVREREKFLRLDSMSYLFSKLVFLFILSAIQSLLFVLVSNFILEIKGMLFRYWIIFFSTSSFANVLGLAISIRFKSIVTIYIMVPVLLIPQLLLSGAIIDFDKVNYRYSSFEHVPVLADLMASRWSYEALVVTEFKDNRFSKEFYDIEMEASNVFFTSTYFIPKLIEKINTLVDDIRSGKGSEHKIKALKKIIKNLLKLDRAMYKKYHNINKNEVFTTTHLIALKKELYDYKHKLDQKFDELDEKRENGYIMLIKELGSVKELKKFENRFVNERLTEMVLKQNQIEKIIDIDGNLIRKFEPAYQMPWQINGRAHFYSPYKLIGKYKFDTLYFNVIVIWIMIFFVNYYILYKLRKKSK